METEAGDTKTTDIGNDLWNFENDPENPRNWPNWRKWSIVVSIVPIDLTVSWLASGFSPALTKFRDEFGVSSEVGTLGLSLYIFGLALGPMVTAPLSEFYGRSPVYLIGYFVFLLFIMASALAPDVGGFLPIRFICGLFASITIANFGGTIADLWHPHDTGLAMSFFLWAATCGSPTGYFLMSFVAQTRGWRDVFWSLLGICGGFWLIWIFVLKETRHDAILRKRARSELKANGGVNATDPKFDILKHRSLKNLFSTALLRPFRFLGTEAIIIFGALYNGYLYGLSYLFNGAFSLVFGQEGHGFDTIGVGLAFLGIAIGISIGPITNLWQERYYQRRTGYNKANNIPEARVQLGMVAAIVFPISLFWFAWTTYKSVPWIVPIIASGFWGWSFYTLILMTYTFTEDSYGQYSASALAGLGLIRNLAGGGFPLFGEQMFMNEGYQWAGSILAFLAVVLVPIPFVLNSYGRELRKRSPWASAHMTDLTESEEQWHLDKKKKRGAVV